MVRQWSAKPSTAVRICYRPQEKKPVLFMQEGLFPSRLLVIVTLFAIAHSGLFLFPSSQAIAWARIGIGLSFTAPRDSHPIRYRSFRTFLFPTPQAIAWARIGIGLSFAAPRASHPIRYRSFRTFSIPKSSSYRLGQDWHWPFLRGSS